MRQRGRNRGEGGIEKGCEKIKKEKAKRKEKKGMRIITKKKETARKRQRR